MIRSPAATTIIQCLLLSSQITLGSRKSAIPGLAIIGFSAYISQFTFSGDIEIQIATDGKFLIRGQLTFCGGILSLSAKLYADLSQIDTGSVTILFLADIPDQFRFLVLKGKFTMGFKGGDGKRMASARNAGSSQARATTRAPLRGPMRFS